MSRNGPSFELTLIPFTEDCFMSNLVENGLVSLTAFSSDENEPMKKKPLSEHFDHKTYTCTSNKIFCQILF